MIEKTPFGELSANKLGMGDIVEWSRWNSDSGEWNINYGIIIEIKNEIKSNRLISISRVIPLQSPVIEIEFFTLSLRLVSPSKRDELKNDIKN